MTDRRRGLLYVPAMTQGSTKIAARTAHIAAAAKDVAARLDSLDAKQRLVAAAAVSRVRSRKIVRAVNVDPRFLAKRVTF